VHFNVHFTPILKQEQRLVLQYFWLQEHKEAFFSFAFAFAFAFTFSPSSSLTIAGSNIGKVGVREL
jgi:hypothetical protein